MSLQALCFVDMPFEKKQDPSTGVEIDFDQVYNDAIKPAILAAGLDAIRGDEERTGGIIHAPMFARLLLSEYVVADLTLANPNGVPMPEQFSPYRYSIDKRPVVTF